MLGPTTAPPAAPCCVTIEQPPLYPGEALLLYYDVTRRVRPTATEMYRFALPGLVGWEDAYGGRRSEAALAMAAGEIDVVFIITEQGGGGSLRGPVVGPVAEREGAGRGVRPDQKIPPRVARRLNRAHHLQRARGILRRAGAGPRRGPAVIKPAGCPAAAYFQPKHSFCLGAPPGPAPHPAPGRGAHAPKVAGRDFLATNADCAKPPSGVSRTSAL